MAINFTLYELLEKCVEFKKKEDRVGALQYNDSPAMRAVLQCMFDPNIEFLLPEGDPPFKPSQFDDPGYLFANIRKLNIFVKGGVGYETVAKNKREMLFIGFLESLNPSEAKLVLSMKDKKSPFKNLTEEIVLTAFPGLFPA